MKFAIITHVPHLHHRQKWYAYAPYVTEMNLWIKNADSVLVIAPVAKREDPTAIHTNYSHSNIELKGIPSFDIKSFRSKMVTILKLPLIIFTIVRAMRQAGHIHLRCPGNIGLLGCFVQIFFPNKPKTAKYAGNWDPKAKQPWSYKLQKWILSNTFLTKNMQVLVYGEWPNQTKNIRSFFTATYSEAEKKPILSRSLDDVIELLFVGTLSAGKRPAYALKLAEALHQKGYKIRLRFYGEGVERSYLEDYIDSNNLASVAFLMGNRTKEEVRQAYQQSHFLILPSKSEGWPKAVAEAMFWGCVPLATPVSCVSVMLNGEDRGLLLTMNLERDAEKIISVIRNPLLFHGTSESATEWSRRYTLEKFESEIQKLLQR